MNEIEIILTKLMDCGRGGLYLDKERPSLNLRQYNRFENILKKRLAGEPLQYLLRSTEFMGLQLRVKPGVLIPRPETEILVEQVLNIVPQRASASASQLKILDIGTGSGNIAVSLAKFLENTEICAVDISDVCLSVAKSNARLNKVNKKIKFYKSDLFGYFKDRKEKFDIIVSNPPYIAPSEYENLPRDVRCEPKHALLAKENGLYFYRKIEQGAKKYLAPGGFIFLEMGFGQAEEIKNIFSDSSFWQDIRFVKDFCGVERVAVIRG